MELDTAPTLSTIDDIVSMEVPTCIDNMSISFTLYK